MVQARGGSEQDRELSRTAARFETWRRGRASRRERIPPELWRAAVEASARAGISRTARVLRLNEQELRRRAVAGAAVPSVAQRVAGFVELRPAATLPPSPSWVVELETVVGARLRIEGRCASEIDVASLAATLLRASS
jgi:hypothetical protein